MPFFIRNKRKQGQSNGFKGKSSKTGQSNKEGETGSKGKRRRLARLDEEIESSSEVDSDEADAGKEVVTSDEEEEETPKEKQLRLAKKYLEELSATVAQEEEVDEASHEAVSERLQKDVLTQSGRLLRTVADEYTSPEPGDTRIMRGHQLSVTCAVLSPDSKTAFSASKDGTIIKWCLETHRKLHIVHGGRKGTEKTHVGHTACILCMAMTTDGKFLVTGDANNLILVWNPASCELVHTFRGHRKAVTGLAFRKNTHNVYSCSTDRMIKSWDLDEMAYVETHQGTDMVAIDALMQQCAITVGGREREVLIHNVVAESTRKFFAHTESDCVALINESFFIIGGQDNSLTLWNVNKKKPNFTLRNAHSSSEGQTVEENWITAVASLQFTDLVASGSKDGHVRLWKCAPEFRSLSLLFSIPVPGFVNSLQFSSKGDFLLAGVGQEHRLGRWWRIKQSKNAVCLISLPRNTDTST